MNKIRIEVGYGHYGCNVESHNMSFPEGSKFISVNYNEIKGNYGGASPCDTREEALDTIKHAIKKDAYGEPTNYKAEEVELIDKTDEEFSVSEVFGNDLRKWF